jgi:hypothetical protein
MAMRLIAIGGSDAGISAALRARELDPTAEVTVVLADAYPNFSICGIPYYVSGEVGDWHRLAHRSIADLEASGMTLRLDTVAHGIALDSHQVEPSGRGRLARRRGGVAQLRRADHRHGRGSRAPPNIRTRSAGRRRRRASAALDRGHVRAGRHA